jgi:opacity protein-like surface antigen
MKNIMRICIGAGIMVACAGAVQAGDPGPYIKAEIGPTLMEDTELKEFLGLTTGNKVEFDPGFRFGVGGGYSFSDYVALGGEFGLSYNTFKNIEGSIREKDSGVGNVPLLANVIFKLPNRSRVVPYAGAGAGVSFAFFSADDMVFDSTPGTPGGETIIDGEESTAVFAWQAFGGLKFEINDNMSLGLAYKYLHAQAPEWEAEDVLTGFDSDIRLGQLKTHAVTFVFSMKF